MTFLTPRCRLFWAVDQKTITPSNAFALARKTQEETKQRDEEWTSSPSACRPIKLDEAEVERLSVSRRLNSAMKRRGTFAPSVVVAVIPVISVLLALKSLLLALPLEIRRFSTIRRCPSLFLRTQVFLAVRLVAVVFSSLHLTKCAVIFQRFRQYA